MDAAMHDCGRNIPVAVQFIEAACQKERKKSEKVPDSLTRGDLLLDFWGARTGA